MKNAIDPAKVPVKKLSNGMEIPCIGLGTFGSDKYNSEQIAAAVLGAVRIGYRLIDCAEVYGNEKEIGGSISQLLGEGIKREDLFIQSKVWNDHHKCVVESCKNSLLNLGLDYLDSYYVHWPFPNAHESHCTIDSRDDKAEPYIHEHFMETWAQMEELVISGLVRSISVSNVTIPKLDLILRDCKIKPVMNEMEMHPSFQQPELFDYCLKNGIQPVGYCPVGSPSRPERDTDPNDVVDMKMPELIAIAEAHNVHPAIICLKWAVQNGQIPIPFSVKEEQYYNNLLAATEDPLTADEMKVMKSLDRNCRFIKGHVFMWPGAEDWYDLWDINGYITK